ncbi:hypothetical protein I4U23_003149 [Adineta vaga]|nr:hypothetical protein I4U23_003149 [Adineta vaga]
MIIEVNVTFKYYSKCVWFLTTGLNKGVSNVIGQSLYRHQLLYPQTSKSVVIGMTHWGTVTQHTRNVLKNLSWLTSDESDSRKLNDNEEKTLNKHHTHFLLLDTGKINCYLSDGFRSEFVKQMREQTKCFAITFIIEGGFGTLEVIENDLEAHESVIIVQGSGRLADILGILLEKTKDETKLEDHVIESYLKKIPYRSLEDQYKPMYLKQTKLILEPRFRRYLKIFQLHNGSSLTDTIFSAVIETPEAVPDGLNLLDLAIRWNCIDGAMALWQEDKIDPKFSAEWFEKALKENRPSFIDYYLRRNLDPLTTNKWIDNKDKTEKWIDNKKSKSLLIVPPTNQDPNADDSSKDLSLKDKARAIYALNFILEKLYENKNAPREKSMIPTSLIELNAHYAKYVGSYAQSFFFNRENGKQILKHPLSIKIKVWLTFVLLLHIKSRIGAALLATYIARRLAINANKMDRRHEYTNQAELYEKYATTCINCCHKYDENRACQLLLREIPLFGNITCMQIAIASRNQSFINTHLFNQVLKTEWYGYLDDDTNKSMYSKCAFILNLLFFGIPASFLSYRPTDAIEQFKSKAMTAMLFDDIYRVIVEYHTQMIERWHLKSTWILPMYALPYILFYIGFALHMRSTIRPDLFTAARIMLAFDLEIWFLFSLRFVSAIKLLGPKLFMIRNMMRDLISIIYLIFVCIAAYGVVSRALFMYNNIEFTAQNVFTSIFYRPYWFLYSIVDEERNDLDGIISSNISTSRQVSEATVTHVLLTFHMLFINILLLNLLIAAFNFSIQRVEDKNKFYWRYQRYELLREYFEKPLLAIPPLSLLVYSFVLIMIFCNRGTNHRILKRRTTSKLDKAWTDFEHLATYHYARKTVEDNYQHRREPETLQTPIMSEVTPNGSAQDDSRNTNTVHRSSIIEAPVFHTNPLHRKIQTISLGSSSV